MDAGEMHGEELGQTESELCEAVEKAFGFFRGSQHN